MNNNSSSPVLGIVMPAYNEEGCIKEVIQGWLKVVDSIAAQENRQALFIVVNDGSRDQTGKILDKLAEGDSRLVVVHQANQGHGAALLNAMNKATELSCEWVFHTDSDNQFSTEDFEKFWSVRHQSKFILGHRKIRHDAKHRLVITRIVRFLNLLMMGVAIPDANIPYRLIQGKYLKDLLSLLPENVFAPNIFLSVIAARDSQDLKNITVVHLPRETGVVSILRWKLLKVCFRTARELFNFRIGLDARIATLKSDSKQGQRASIKPLGQSGSVK